MARAFVLALAATLLLSGCNGENNPLNKSRGSAAESKPSASAQDAAVAGLTAFRALVNQGNYQGLGFASATDVQRAQLSDPMPIYIIGLDGLQKYQASQPANLVTDAHKSFYPVTVDSTVVSSITVAQRGDGWRATDFGSTALSHTLAQFRQSKEDMIVWVPALKIYFTARHSGNSLMLTPIRNDPRLEFKAGEAVPLDRAIIILKRAAEGYNGLPQ